MASSSIFRLLVLLGSFRSSTGTTLDVLSGTSGAAAPSSNTVILEGPLSASTLLSTLATRLSGAAAGDAQEAPGSLPSGPAGSIPSGAPPATTTTSAIDAATSSAINGPPPAVPTGSLVSVTLTGPPSVPLGQSATVSTSAPTDAPASVPAPASAVISDPHTNLDLVKAWALCTQPVSFTQATCPTTTLAATAKPTAKLPNMTPDEGWTFGWVRIFNHCLETFYVWSVGVNPLGGCRDNATGFGTCEEMTMHTINPGEIFYEWYRITCFKEHDLQWYCPEVDKAAGQGVSLKISSTKEMVNINQFEYSLVRDTARGDKFERLNYDISMLDCASKNAGSVTDASAAEAEAKGDKSLHQAKIDGCPGYKGGLAVMFDGNNTHGGATNCPPIFCDGNKVCQRIYTYDRTRVGEASLACEAEYRGNMTLHLCLSDDAESFSSASNADQKWRSTATKIPGAWGENPSGVPSSPASGPISNAAATPSGATSAATPPINAPASAPAPSKRGDENGGSPPLVDWDIQTLADSTLSTVVPASKRQDKGQPVSVVHVTRTTVLTVRTSAANPEAQDETFEHREDGASDESDEFTTAVPSNLHKREIFTPTQWETVTTSIVTVSYHDQKKGEQTGICVPGIFEGECQDCVTGSCDTFLAHDGIPHLYRCQCPPFDVVYPDNSAVGAALSG